ncbi:MAG: hypothetical protein ACHQX3_11510, partial [Nitrospirales bacterium]
HHVDWTLTVSGTNQVVLSKTTLTQAGLSRTLSFSQPIQFQTMILKAITKWSNGDTIKIYETIVNAQAAAEGEVRCGQLPANKFGCNASRPQNASGPDQAIRWQIGENNGSQPHQQDLQPGLTFEIPAQFNGRNVRISATGLGTAVNWGPLFIDIKASWWGGSIYLPLVTNLVPQNPPPTATPSPTPPPVSPTPTQPPAQQPTFSVNHEDRTILVNLNGNPAGTSWMWGLKAKGFFDYGYSPAVAPGTMLNYGQYEFPMDGKLIITHADNTQSVYDFHFDS